MTLKEKLRFLLDEYGRGGKAKLAERLDVSANYITRYAEEQYSDTFLPSKYFKKTADFFGVEPTYFLDDEITTKPVRTVKVIGTASCGGLDLNHFQCNRFALFNGDDYNERYYCVIANGDSMSPEIDDGDEVICDPQAEIINGDMVHYTIGNESALKVYFKDEDAYIVQFVPYNPSDTFKTRTVRLDDDSVEIKMAKVISVNKRKTNNRLARLKLIGRS